MQQKVKRWGNSPDVCIFRPLANWVRIGVGSVVEVEVEDGVITITAVAPKECVLDELVAGITDENRYQVMETGAPIGDEVW